MTEVLELRPQDRLLVVAPHPDDESIGAGGLLQVARAAGADVRVLVLTDGDNNPWPQRWIEKRWRIGPAERARWGARRRAEAQAALRVLGVSEAQTRFLGFPDLGLTDLLMRADSALVGALRQTVDEFAPTLLVVPAISDRHPDHNAAHVAARLALGVAHVETIRLLAFAVHGGAAAQGRLTVPLDEARRRTKQAAILAHATQMQFSQRRFLAFAGEFERFALASVPAQSEANHPLQARVDARQLHVHIDLHRWGRPLRDEVLHVVLDGNPPLRFSLQPTGPHAMLSKQVAAKDHVDVAIGLPAHDMGRQGFVKLARREPGWRVFDRFGWQAVAT